MHIIFVQIALRGSRQLHITIPSDIYCNGIEASSRVPDLVRHSQTFANSILTYRIESYMYYAMRASRHQKRIQYTAQERN